MFSFVVAHSKYVLCHLRLQYVLCPFSVHLSHTFDTFVYLTNNGVVKPFPPFCTAPSLFSHHTCCWNSNRPTTVRALNTLWDGYYSKHIGISSSGHSTYEAAKFVCSGNGQSLTAPCRLLLVPVSTPLQIVNHCCLGFPVIYKCRDV